MAATDRNCEIKKKYIKFPFIFLNNLKSVDSIECNFLYYKYPFCLHFYRLWAAAPLAPSSLRPSVYLSWFVHKNTMTVVQTAVLFVTVEAIPLHKVIAGFTSSLLQHQRQYSAHIVLSCYPVRQSVSCKHNRWQHDRHRSVCALD